MSAGDTKTKLEEKEKRKRQDDLRKQIDVDQLWKKVESHKEKIKPVIDDRPGWKTVRIFVSSTFKDFHQEREVLTKHVFADLRAWCEERRLHLIDCDLRWGVPKETTSEVIVKTCLEEIDRCYKDNKVPYFVNMTCKRVGWIPLVEEMPPNLLDNYRLVFGLSVTEMEIVHAAYRIENPNALFLIRDDSFLDEIEDERIKKEFIDELQPKAEEKLQVLKDKITNRFPNRVVNYKCKYVEGQRLYSGEKGRPKLQLEENFAETVLNFFKERISQQYPLVEMTDLDPYVSAKYLHESFLTSQCATIIGRENIVKEICDYVENDSVTFPKLIIGEAGVGKSSIMAKATSEMLNKLDKKLLSCKMFPDEEWKVFYHFVGAVPNSTNLLEILRRLLKEMRPDQDIPEKLQDTLELVKCELGNDKQKPIVIFIDAVNQIDEEMRIEQFSWLPEKLSQNVRCVLSMLPDSGPHMALKKRKDLPISAEITVPDLSIDDRMDIVKNYLTLFNKKLEDKPLVTLMLKNSSKNPLWLRMACEELRVYGDFSTVDEFTKSLQDGLPDLLKQILERFERETDKDLLVSTLCLLEVSKFGLLETELLEILADKENLPYREIKRDYNPEESGAKREERDRNFLPAAEWASVYRNLRVFLRPYGSPSEGRLDFYHRSLSKVVREKYLSGASKEEDKDKLWWWHKKLADFYHKSRIYDRKVEEYPYHLLQLKIYARDKVEASHYCQQLENFLRDVEAFKQLYDHEFSGTLLYYWRECGDSSYSRMTQCYLEDVNLMQSNRSFSPAEVVLKLQEVSRLLTQAGKYREALEMAKRCLNLLEAYEDKFKKEEMDERLMYLYEHIARNKSLLLPPTQNASEIPELEQIIDLHNKAIDIIRSSSKRNNLKYKKNLALQLNRKAFARGGIADRCQYFSLSNLINGKKLRKEMITQGLKEVEEAISIYCEVNDFGHELEAKLTLATLYRGNKDKQLEIYKYTRKKCREIFGKDHHLMCRLCRNTGIVYEDEKEYENAYKYFRKAYDVALKVYGPEHSMTQKYRGVLKNGKYLNIGKRLRDKLD